MLKEIHTQLEICLQNFKIMISKGIIPAKMIIKLQYLEAVIMDLKTQRQFLEQLPMFQKLSLQQMNRETQISLFISIVKCLSGQEIIQYFHNQKSTLRKEQSFSGWTSCYLNCDSNRMWASKKSEGKEVWHEFFIEKLWISKIYRQHKKRYLFGIAYDKHKYQVGFEEEGTCARIHSILINLIRQRRTLREKLKQISIAQSNQSELTTELQFQKEQGIFDHDFDEEEYIQFEEREYLSHIQQRVMKLQLFDNSAFELVKNIEKGRILQSKSQGSFKICLILQRLSISTILEKFIEFSQWNTQIQAFRIITRVRSNTFLAYLKLKKFSMLTYPRETTLTITYLRTCSCLTPPQQQEDTKLEHGKHYLLLKSVENEQSSSSMGTVRMNLEQVVQFSVVEDTPNTIFMILWSKIDFKGYDYFNYNREMNIHFLHDFAYLINYCKQKNTSVNTTCTFDIDYCACKLRKRRKNSIQSEISAGSQKEDKEVEIKKSSEGGSFRKLDVVKAVQKYHDGIIDQELLEIMKKGLFESYCLKHHFTQSIQNKEYKQSNYTYKHEKDYLLQGGRWRIASNDNLVFCNEQAIKAQKGVLKMILKQMGSNLMAGRSIMNMSLPVEIFDNMSMLEVIANMMGFFPRFINDAVNANDPIEQMKFVALSYILLTSSFPNAQKPFNPILGETFQGLLGGIPIYLEQTFHHPPISTLYIRTDDFETFGNFDMHVDLGLNSASSKISYYFTVRIFKSKREYIIRLADVEMGGISFGDRTLRLNGRGFVYQKTNDIYCEFSAGKDKKKVYQYSSKLKPNDLAGGIFKVTNTFGKKLMAMDRGKSFDGVKYDDIIQKYSHISGKWYGDIFFDNTPYKTLQGGPFPLHVERPVHLLPSDCVFRTDIIYKKWNQLGKSNQEKQILQNLQRKDKKLREKNKHR